MKNAYDIIKRPVITEQSMEAVADKKYVFLVAPDANKIEIKQAIEEIFSVKVDKVNTIRMQEGNGEAHRRFQDHRVLRGYGLIQISIKERNAKWLLEHLSLIPRRVET